MLKTLIKHSRLAYKRSPYYKERLVEDALKALLLFWITSAAWSNFLTFAQWLKETYSVSKEQSGFLFLLLFPLLDLMIRYFFQSTPNLSLVPYLPLRIKRKTIVNSIFIRSFLSPWFIILLFLSCIAIFVFSFFDYSVPTKITIAIYILGILLLNHILNFWIKLGGKSRQNLLFILYGAVTLLVLAQRFGLIDIIPPMLKGSNAFFSSIFPAFFPAVLFTAISYFFLRELPNHLTSFKDESVSGKSLPFQFFSKYGLVGKQVDYEILMGLRLKAVRGILIFSIFWVAYPLIIGMSLSEESAARDIMGLLMGMFTSYGIVQYGNYCFSWHTFHYDAIQANQNIRTVLWGKYYFMMLIGLVYAVIATVFYAFVQPWFIPYIWIGFYFNICVSVFLALYYAIRFTKPKDPYKRSIINTSNTEFNTETIVISLIYFAFLLVPYAIGALIWNKAIGLVAVLLLCLIMLLLRKKMMAHIVELYKNNRYKMHQKFKNFSE